MRQAFDYIDARITDFVTPTLHFLILLVFVSEPYSTNSLKVTY